MTAGLPEPGHERAVRGRALASPPPTEGPGTGALLRMSLAVGWYRSHGPALGWPLSDALCWFSVELLLRNNGGGKYCVGLFHKALFFFHAILLLPSAPWRLTNSPHIPASLPEPYTPFLLTCCGGNSSWWSLLVAREKGKGTWPFFQRNKGI